MLYLVIFFVAIILLLLIQVNMELKYVKNGSDDWIVIYIRGFGGLLKYKYEILSVDMEESGIKFKKKKGLKEKNVDKDKSFLGFDEFYKKFKYYKGLYEENKKIISNIKKYLEKWVILEKIKMEVAVGTGDAFYTGISSGIIWMLAGIIVSRLSNSFKTFKKYVNVKTDFVEKKFKVDVYCIFDIRIVHIIVVGLKLLFYWLNSRLRRKLKAVV